MTERDAKATAKKINALQANYAASVEPVSSLKASGGFGVAVKCNGNEVGFANNKDEGDMLFSQIRRMRRYAPLAS